MPVKDLFIREIYLMNIYYLCYDGDLKSRNEWWVVVKLNSLNFCMICRMNRILKVGLGFLFKPSFNSNFNTGNMFYNTKKRNFKEQNKLFTIKILLSAVCKYRSGIMVTFVHTMDGLLVLHILQDWSIWISLYHTTLWSIQGWYGIKIWRTTHKMFNCDIIGGLLAGLHIIRISSKIRNCWI